MFQFLKERKTQKIKKRIDGALDYLSTHYEKSEAVPKAEFSLRNESDKNQHTAAREESCQVKYSGRSCQPEEKDTDVCYSARDSYNTDALSDMMGRYARNLDW